MYATVRRYQNAAALGDAMASRSGGLRITGLSCVGSEFQTGATHRSIES